MKLSKGLDQLGLILLSIDTADTHDQELIGADALLPNKFPTSKGSFCCITCFWEPRRTWLIWPKASESCRRTLASFAERRLKKSSVPPLVRC